ncbi:hypothetical protein GGI13_007723 [Coemansia sp. RSA 455]|nr:hypothetical protein GGI13_007723 [Coemansia sp. RSA 455]
MFSTKISVVLDGTVQITHTLNSSVTLAQLMSMCKSDLGDSYNNAKFYDVEDTKFENPITKGTVGDLKDEGGIAHTKKFNTFN